MSVLGRYGASALKYWGSILGSAYQGHNTADMWTAIRGAQQQYGLDRPGTSAPDVSVIRGYANRIVNAVRALGAADPSENITAAMTSVVPYSPQTMEGIATTPNYLVTATVTVQGLDGTTTDHPLTWLQAPNPFGQTVGDYLGTVTEHFSNQTQTAPENTNTPTGTLVSISDVHIGIY